MANSGTKRSLDLDAKPSSVRDLVRSNSMLSQGRWLGSLNLLSNLVLIAIATYAFFTYEVAAQSPVLLLLYVAVLLFYGATTIGYIVTQYRHLVEMIRQQSQLQILFQNYLRRSSHMHMATQIARDAANGSTVEDILQRAVDFLCKRFEFDHAGIFMVAEDKVVLQAVSGLSAASKALLESRHELAIGDASIIGHVAQTRKLYLAPDVDSDHYHFANPLMAATKSELAVPLIVDDRLIGVLDVQASTLNAFSQDDITAIRTLADLLAVTLDKAQLTDSLQTRVELRTLDLARERAQLNAILDAMQEAVVYEEEAQIVYANAAFYHLLEYDDAEWDGLLPLLYTQGADPHDVTAQYERITRLVLANHQWRGETRIRSRNGREFDAYTTILHIPSYQNVERDGTLIIIRDTSHEKELQKMRKRFVSYASHELRTPLANIKTRLYLMKRSPEKFDEHHRIMEQVAQRMQRIVDDLLEQSRFEAGQIKLNYEVRPLQTAIQTVYDEQHLEAAEKDHHFSIDMEDEPILVQMDQGRIVQVLTNLVSNAINYTPRSGTILIKVRKQSASVVTVDVMDNGIGIPAHLLNQVFMPFFRVNDEAKGTGLGLNISQRIAELHAGSLTVVSEEGTGTTFTLSLPVYIPLADAKLLDSSQGLIPSVTNTGL